MSASRQFRKLANSPLDRQSRQRGGILGALLRAEKKAEEDAARRPSALPRAQEPPEDDDELLEDGGEEEENEDEEEKEDEEDEAPEMLLEDDKPKPAKRKRKAHKKKRRSIANWLHKKGTCLLCSYKPENFRCDSLLRHWQTEHPTHLKAAQAAQDDGKDLLAAVGALVESVRGPQGSILNFVKKKARVQPQRWHKELGIIRFIVRKKIPFDALDSEEFSDMLRDFNVSLDGKGVFLDLIASLYEFTLEVKRARLHKCAGLSVAADFWTSKAHRKYLAIAYFGIDDDWNLVHEVMDLVRFPGTTIAEVCQAVMQTRVDRHAAKDQLIAQYTTDNGSDLKRMRDLLETDHDDCINHVMNSSFGDLMALNIKMTKDFKTMEYIVAAIESDKNLKLCFQALQLHSSDDWTEALEFVHRTVTRWLSAILFMERFSRFEKVFCNTEAEYHNTVFSHVMQELPEGLSEDILEKKLFPAFEWLH
jgi:hypothetical protein